jgi:hypothetical protein
LSMNTFLSQKLTPSVMLAEGMLADVEFQLQPQTWLSGVSEYTHKV